MSRVYNFSSGPAAVPEPVLERIRDELLDFDGLGSSVMEISHRGKPFLKVAERAMSSLRSLLNVPSHYEILFLQGGAQTQFAAVPLNLASNGRSASYVNTGHWSTKAITEAKRITNVHLVASSEDRGFNYVPDQSTWDVDLNAAYLHYTPNETIGGVEFHWTPTIDTPPLVIDLSSTILSRPIDVSKFGLIYAGAQKNAGIAGLTIVIFDPALLNEADPKTPTTLNYAAQAKQDSMANTPVTFAWYVAALVFEWIQAEGGVTVLAERNRRKAETLYQAIDTSNFFHNPVAKNDRSWMNVTFVLPDPSLDSEFLALAERAGLDGLKGHRSVGGMRASIYNAMPETGVDRLVEVMSEFASKHR